MYGLGSGTLPNIVLDPLLIFTVGMGFSGVGAATLIGEIVGCFILLWHPGRDDHTNGTALECLARVAECHCDPGVRECTGGYTDTGRVCYRCPAAHDFAGSGAQA